VIRNPEITKKTSTPRNPPAGINRKAVEPIKRKWTLSTRMIEIARRPSSGGRYRNEIDESLFGVFLFILQIL
jgi:hypothetical protein